VTLADRVDRAVGRSVERAICGHERVDRQQAE